MRSLRFIPLLFLVISFIFPESYLYSQDTPEDTYTISLVQTAEADKEAGREVVQLDDRKVLTETYRVKSGDHLWKIMREKGLLQRRNLQELLQVLKRLNSSLENLNLVRPGETLVIPLTITPSKGTADPVKRLAEPTVVPLEALKEVDLEQYTVKPGDTLIKIVKSRFDIPDNLIHDEYLSLLKRMNPAVRDVNVIHPGQRIRLPVYSPQVVRMAVKEPPAGKKPVEEPKEGPKEGSKEGTPAEEGGPLAGQLSDLFTLMGFEWIRAGQHFIPLKTGGQVSLKADSFPILNLTDGTRVVVDLFHELPEKMSAIITSNWDNYRIVQLSKGDGLRAALEKILSACRFPRLYRPGEPLEITGDITAVVKADWIVQTAADPAAPKGRFVAVTLLDTSSARTPPSIVKLLETAGIRIVEYPAPADPVPEPSGKPEILRFTGSPTEVVERLLEMSGLSFSSGVEIPIFQNRKEEFNLTVKADFLLRVQDKDSVIDLTGLGPEIVSLLAEHQFRILSLTASENLSSVLSRVLGFLEIPFDPYPHTFRAANRDEARNTLITVPGITFSDKEGKRVFVTAVPLSDALAGFLSGKGYRILEVRSGG
jgi:LysM repeat protein